MRFLLPLLLLSSFFIYGVSPDAKLETMLSHQSNSNSDDQDQELLIEENLHGGKILKLNNGTTWEVAPQDVHITEIWIFPFPLKLEKSNNPNYPYYLVNKRSKTKVLVRPLASMQKKKEGTSQPTTPSQPSPSKEIQQPPSSKQPEQLYVPQQSPNAQPAPPPQPIPLDR